jgi:hypothetical protein
VFTFYRCTVLIYLNLRKPIREYFLSESVLVAPIAAARKALALSEDPSRSFFECTDGEIQLGRELGIIPEILLRGRIKVCCVLCFTLT